MRGMRNNERYLYRRVACALASRTLSIDPTALTATYISVHNNEESSTKYLVCYGAREQLLTKLDKSY